MPSIGIKRAVDAFALAVTLLERMAQRVAMSVLRVATCSVVGATALLCRMRRWPTYALSAAFVCARGFDSVVSDSIRSEQI